MSGAAEAVVATLAAAGLDADVVAPHTWMTVLAGERKRRLPVLLRLTQRSLTVSALLAGAPDEGHAEVFRYLLTRNRRLRAVHFALDDEGDILLVGALPRELVDADAVDRLLGAVLTTADETFEAVLRRGFATYIAAEQRWRAARGLPPNPVSRPDAPE